MMFALQYRVGFCHTSHFATPWTIACQAPLSMGFPTCQVCGNPCSSKKGEWSADQVPDVDTWGHLPFGFPQFLFLESLPGGTHTIWILITCGWLTHFLIRLLCPGTSAESFTQEERSEMIVSKVMEAFTQQVRARLIISSKRRRRRRECLPRAAIPWCTICQKWKVSFCFLQRGHAATDEEEVTIHPICIHVKNFLIFFLCK